MVLPMKITRNTPEQLIIDIIPWLSGITISAFILIFAGTGLFLISQSIWAGLILFLVACCFGIALFAVFVHRTQLILNRPSNTVTLRTRTLFGLTQIEDDLTNLSCASLDSIITAKGSTLYRPSLVLEGMNAGSHPIMASYSHTSVPDKMVKAINAWLAPNPP